MAQVTGYKGSLTIRCERPGECLLVLSKLLEWGASFELHNYSTEKFSTNVSITGFGERVKPGKESWKHLRKELEDCE